jgi:predicted SprT family Zn-dependent metalloprotease
LNLAAAKTLANRLLIKHDLPKWNFKFDRARRRFGSCNFSNKTISLSEILTELNSSQKVLNTILHEIAHALVGPRHAHDSVWKQKVAEIGGEAKARFRESEVTIPKSKLVAICPNCKKEFPTFRRRKNVACRDCCRKYNSGKFNPKFCLKFCEN